MKQKYDKLVRDKIPEEIEQKDESYSSYVADDEEYKKRLRDKLVEEAKEFREDGTIEELADILEVIDAICNNENISREEIKSVRQTKADRRGIFKDRIILEWVKEIK